MSYTKKQYEKEIKEWNNKHKGKAYTNTPKKPTWIKKVEGKN